MEKASQDKIHKLKTMGIWIIILLIFIVQMLFYTWCRIQCVRVGYEISDETEQHQKLITLQNNLKIELSRLKSPDRIAKIAKHHLGLAMPVPEQIIIVPTSTPP